MTTSRPFATASTTSNAAATRLIANAFMSTRRAGESSSSVQPLDRGGGDLSAAAVDRERVAAVRELAVVRHVGAAVAPESLLRDCARDGVVLAAGDEQQRPAGALRVHLRG